MKILLLILFLIINFIPQNYVTLKIYLMSGLLVFWIFYVLGFIWHVQKDRAVKNKFEKHLYIKDIPTVRTVVEVGYLLHGKIHSSMLGTSIIELVRKKALLLRYNPKDKDYVFIYNNVGSEKLTYAEKFLLDWLLSKIGNGQRVTFAHIKKDARTNSAYFLSCYENWNTLASFEGAKPNFFETKNNVVDGTIGFIVLSIILALLGLYNHLPTPLIIASLFATLILIIYINSFYLRTKEGNSEYSRWVSFSHSIKRGDACNNISDLSSLERVIVYSKLMNQNTDKMMTTILTKDGCPFDNSEFIMYARSGIIDEICSKINKLVPTALLVSFVFARNKGSRASVKYKRKEEA